MDTHCGTPTTTTRPPLYGPSEQPSLSTLLPLPSLVLTSVFDIYYIELVILLDKSIDAYIIPFPCNICPNIIKMQMNHCYVMYELVDTAHTHWPIRDRSRSTRLFTSTILAVHKLGRRFSQLNICWQKVFQYNFGIWHFQIVDHLMRKGFGCIQYRLNFDRKYHFDDQYQACHFIGYNVELLQTE